MKNENPSPPILWGLLASLVLAPLSCRPAQTSQKNKAETSVPSTVVKPLPPTAPAEVKLLVEAAVAQEGVTKSYDPSYVTLDYPNGDVAIETGVCSDVIVRAFRKVGIDLQKEVHEDMRNARSIYPTRWGATAIDSSIDHRRVLNLMTYFDRQGKSLTISREAKDYLPGDIVAWDLGGGIDHIGIITNRWDLKEQRYLIVHNIGAGTKVEDRLFDWQITGHYRYFR